MCFYQPVSKLVMFEHQGGGGIVFSNYVSCVPPAGPDRVWLLRTPPLAAVPPAQGTVRAARLSGGTVWSPGLPPPLTSPTPHSPIPKIYERGLREPWSVDLFCYLPDQESPWTDRSWTEIGLVDGNVLHIGECALMPGKKVLQLHFLRNILHAQKIKSGFLDSSYAVSSVQKRAEFMFDDFANLNLHFT